MKRHEASEREEKTRGESLNNRRGDGGLDTDQHTDRLRRLTTCWSVWRTELWSSSTSSLLLLYSLHFFFLRENWYSHFLTFGSLSFLISLSSGDRRRRRALAHPIAPVSDETLMECGQKSRSRNTRHQPRGSSPRRTLCRKRSLVFEDETRFIHFHQSFLFRDQNQYWVSNQNTFSLIGYLVHWLKCQRGWSCVTESVGN